MYQPTPGLPEFEYVQPDSLSEASRFLADHVGEARPFLGGTDTFVRMRDGVWQEKYLIDVKRLDGLKEILFDPERGLSIGAAVSMNQVISNQSVATHYPLLAQACSSVGSFQLRSRATVIGNICNASPAGDTIGACIVLKGSLRVHGVDGYRDELLDDFFLGPGQTRLKPGDLVVSIHFPLPPADHAGHYVKLGRNTLSDLAIVGVTALGFPDQTAASGFRFRLALASVAPTPVVPYQAEQILSENNFSTATVRNASEAAQEIATPISDPRGSARYRKMMVRNMTQKAIEVVWERLRRN